MSKPLKAYVVRGGDEGECKIVFSTNGATARRKGADKLGLSFEEVESCCREPSFDQYAPGPVPLKATLAHGWWHTCCGCEVTFDKDGRSDGDDEREDEFDPVSDAKGQHFCSPTCMMMEWATLRESKAREHAVIEACATRWPEATSIYACRSRRAGHVEFSWLASFSLPGLKYNVEQLLGDTFAYVSPYDADEFKARYGAKP